MTHPRPIPARRRAGSAYVLVLTTAMIVTVIGLSAISATRIRTRLTSGEHEAVRARVIGQSAAEVVTQRLSASSNWRTTYTHNVWTSEEAWSDAMVSFKLADDAGNAGLNADPLAAARLYVKSRINATTRLYSVQLKPKPPTLNTLVSNGGVESGASSWLLYSGYEQLQVRANDNPHGGTNHLRCYNRTASWAGPIQDITSQLSSSGTTHYAEVWVRMKDTTDNVRITMLTRNWLGQERYFNGSNTSVGTNWTRVTATLAPTWSLFLSQALIYVETNSSTQEFFIDDLLLIVGNGYPATKMQPVAGTLRQDTQ